LRRDGVIDSTAERYAVEARRPIEEHLAEFIEALRGKGVEGDTVKLVESRVRRLLKMINAKSLEVVSNPVEIW